MRRLILALALALAACSSPPVRFFALPGPAAAPAGATRALVLGPVRVPAWLARSQIAWRVGDAGLQFDDNARWGTAFDAEFLRALGEHLGAAAGTLDVVAWPARTGSPDALRVSVEVEQLDVRGDAPCRLRARFAVRQGEEDAVVASGIADVRAELSGSGPEGIVRAYGDLVAGLAREIAARLP